MLGDHVHTSPTTWPTPVRRERALEGDREAREAADVRERSAMAAVRRNASTGFISFVASLLSFEDCSLQRGKNVLRSGWCSHVLLYGQAGAAGLERLAFCAVARVICNRTYAWT